MYLKRQASPRKNLRNYKELCLLVECRSSKDSSAFLLDTWALEDTSHQHLQKTLLIIHIKIWVHLVKNLQTIFKTVIAGESRKKPTQSWNKWGWLHKLGNNFIPAKCLNPVISLSITSFMPQPPQGKEDAQKTWVKATMRDMITHLIYGSRTKLH